MLIGHLSPLRLLPPAYLLCKGAVCMERAAFGGIEGAGELPFEYDAGPSPFLHRIRQKDSRKKCLRVGVLWGSEELLYGGDLDNLPQIHHADTVGDGTDRRRNRC